MSKNEVEESSLEVETVEVGMKDHFFRPCVIAGRCEACGAAHYVGGGVSKTVNKLGEISHHLKGGSWEELDATNCVHYKQLYEKGQCIECAYCREKFTGAKNKFGKFTEKLAFRTVFIISMTDRPKVLIMYCDSFECKNAHLKRINNQI